MIPQVLVGAGLTPSSTLIDRLVSDRVASRLFSGDATLWGPEYEAEAAERLGWTRFEDGVESLIDDIETLRSELQGNGINRVVLCGMGGSSLAPEIITNWAQVPLQLLDSTHPSQVQRIVTCDLQRTVAVVSSKSGSTLDTRSHQAVFEREFQAAGLDIAQHVVVVTDPGSPLEAAALAAGQQVFHADPNVGGRYSALTAFGLVPAGLAGANIRTLVSEALGVHGLLGQDDRDNPALQLAAVLYSALPERFVMASYSEEDADWGLAAWVEQLVAESTGKFGRGVLPVELTSDSPEVRDQLPQNAIRVGISEAPVAPHELGITVSGTLGAQLLLWEAATALLGYLLEINPFDQPDVESAKEAAREILSADSVDEPALSILSDVDDSEVLADLGRRISSCADLVAVLEETLTPQSFLSVQVYLDRAGEGVQELAELRDALASKFGVPVALDWGPRFLHSTGQFHKGGPAQGVYLQILDQATPEFDIPGTTRGFGALITAQAHGDRNVLVARGLPVLALRCGHPASTAAVLTRALQ